MLLLLLVSAVASVAAPLPPLTGEDVDRMLQLQNPSSDVAEQIETRGFLAADIECLIY